MHKHLEILERAIKSWLDPNKPVIRSLVESGLASELDKKLDFALADKGCSLKELEEAIQQFLDYSPNSSDPKFHKLLYSGLNKEALLGDWITSLVNSTMHTFQVSPAATLMELELIRRWNKLVGFDGGEGVMVPGGSQANLVGMMLARHKACESIKTTGLNGRADSCKLRAYVSDQAHYSYQRAVNILGLGSDNLIRVNSDESGAICPAALATKIEQDLKQGHQPFFIGLTAGTTVIGAFDSVSKCSEIAQKHQLWLHIDGAWGASVLFSRRHKRLLADSHLADSFAWDAHKLMNVPITAAVILVKQSGALQACSAGGGGDYLFHSDVNADYNLGERSLQCGRRADALKVWLSWKASGNQGFEDKVEQLQSNKERCLELIEQHESLQLIAPAVYLNVLFRYRPLSFVSNVGQQVGQLDQQAEEKLAELNKQICKTMVREGGPYIDYAQYKGQTGIRLIIANQQTTVSGLAELLRECLRIGSQLEAQFL